MSALLLVLAAAAAPLGAAADTAAPRPVVVSATATAVAEIIRFERAAPLSPAGSAELQRQVDRERREVAFF